MISLPSMVTKKLLVVVGVLLFSTQYCFGLRFTQKLQYDTLDFKEKREAQQELGVSSTDYTEDDLKKAYRKRAKETHPDKTGGDHIPFTKVKAAYEALVADLKFREEFGGHYGAGGGASTTNGDFMKHHDDFMKNYWRQKEDLFGPSAGNGRSWSSTAGYSSWSSATAGTKRQDYRSKWQQENEDMMNRWKQRDAERRERYDRMRQEDAARRAARGKSTSTAPKHPASSTASNSNPTEDNTKQLEENRKECESLYAEDPEKGIQKIKDFGGNTFLHKVLLSSALLKNNDGSGVPHERRKIIEQYSLLEKGQSERHVQNGAGFFPEDIAFLIGDYYLSDILSRY